MSEEERLEYAFTVDGCDNEQDLMEAKKKVAEIRAERVSHSWKNNCYENFPQLIQQGAVFLNTSKIQPSLVTGLLMLLTGATQHYLLAPTSRNLSRHVVKRDFWTGLPMLILVASRLSAWSIVLYIVSQFSLTFTIVSFVIGSAGMLLLITIDCNSAASQAVFSIFVPCAIQNEFSHT